jgi:hypothetical protein
MSSLNSFDRVLTWGDFTPVPAPKEDNGEGASIGVIFDYTHEPGRKGNAIYVSNLVVNVLMPDPTTNTVVVTKKTDLMLKHEQGHYDIIALGAREFYKKALQLTAPSDTELNTLIGNLYDDLHAKAEAVDARYDVKTNHHINQAVQVVWNKAIEDAKKSKTGTIADLPQ